AEAGRQACLLIRVGVVPRGHHIGDPMGALPEGGHLGERAHARNLILDDLALGAKLGLRHVPVDDPKFPGPLQAGFERLHAQPLVPLAPVRLALLESSLDEVASGLLQPLVGVTGAEPAAQLLLENISAHDRRGAGAVEGALAADVVAGHARRPAGLLASHRPTAVIAPEKRGEREGGGAMPWTETLREEAVAHAQI